MKTQVLQLEAHDDVISTRDKLGWKQTGRILLVWPRKGRVLQRRYDLVILWRHVQALGGQLALVTGDSQVRFHAARIGLPVFKSVEQAQHTPWRRARRRRWRLRRRAEAPPDLQALRQAARPAAPAWLDHPAFRLVFFSLGVLAALAVAAALLPSARIELVPALESQQVAIDVQASAAFSGVSLSGRLPARLVEVEVEGREQIPASGSQLVPQTPASGSVVFTNLTGVALELPAGSIVTTGQAPRIRFATTRPGSLPGEAGSLLTLPVQAVNPGESGNLPAASLTALEGPAGLNVAVTNPAPTTGGGDQAVPAPSQADRQRLYAQLAAGLEQTAAGELLGSPGTPGLIDPGDLLLTPQPALAEVLEEIYTPADDSPSASIELSLRLRFQVQVVRQADLQALAAAVLDANLPAGYRPAGGEILIRNQAAPVVDAGGTAAWRIQASRPIQAHPDPQATAALLTGLSPQQAAARLAERLDLAQAPNIRLFPAWWPRLPLLAFRITVQTAGSP